MIAAEVKYKNTGIDCMPEIPEHWDILRIKNLVDKAKYYQIGDGDHGSIKPEDYKDSGIPYIRVQNLSWGFELDYDGMVYISKEVHESNLKSKLIPGDILIAKTGATIGKTAIIPESIKEANTTSSVGKVTIDKERFSVNYIGYCFTSKVLHHQIWSDAIQKSAQPGFNIDDLVIYKIPIPPFQEQKLIADFLDEQSAKITRFIQSKQRFIELLKEQRQSIITNSVTKGIDDGVKMKDTVLGEIPEHWEVRRLGTIGRFSKGGNISRSELIYTDEGVPAILYGDLYTKYDIVAENIINRVSKETAAKSVELKKGDLLFTGSGETKEDIGKCIIFNSDEPAYAGGDVIIFKQDIFDSYFISYSQNSSIAKHQKAIFSKGEIIVHTYGSKLRDVIMPYPPTIEEQKRTVEHIKTETRTLDIAISKAEREIELIKEYREAMIAEAVTGKMKL